MFSKGIARKGTLLCLLHLAPLDRERLRKPLRFVLVLGGDFLLRVSLTKVVVTFGHVRGVVTFSEEWLIRSFVRGSSLISHIALSSA